MTDAAKTEIQNDLQLPKPRKPRGPYGPRKPKDGSAPKAAKPKQVPLKKIPFMACQLGHLRLMKAYKARTIFGIQRPQTETEKILEAGLREVMGMLAPFAADGESDE